MSNLSVLLKYHWKFKNGRTFYTLEATTNPHYTIGIFKWIETSGLSSHVGYYQAFFHFGFKINVHFRLLCLVSLQYLLSIAKANYNSNFCVMPIRKIFKSLCKTRFFGIFGITGGFLDFRIFWQVVVCDGYHVRCQPVFLRLPQNVWHEIHIEFFDICFVVRTRDPL